MHAFGAVLARRAAVFVDALGLALAAAHTGAAGPEGGGSDNAGHDQASGARGCLCG